MYFYDPSSLFIGVRESDVTVLDGIHSTAQHNGDRREFNSQLDAVPVSGIIHVNPK